MSDSLDPSYESKISDQELKDKLTEEYNQSANQKEVKQSQFPTEIVDLPSQGLLYPKDNPLSSGKVELKYMTAKEEDILTTQSYIKQGVVIDKLLQALVVSNGEGKTIKFNDLITGDKNAIMIAARLLGYGKDYEVKMQDPFSGNTQTESIDLSEVSNIELHDLIYKNKHKNRFGFTLPTSKKKVIWRALNHGNERKIDHLKKEIAKKNKRAKIKMKDVADPSLTLRLKMAIVSIDGDEDKKSIDSFIDNQMLALDSRALRNHIAEVQPDVDLKFTFTSADTGDEKEIEIPIDVQFFWPDADV